LLRESQQRGVTFEKPELLLLTLSTVPDLENRLRVWCYMMEFNEMKKDSQVPLEAIKVAIRDTRQSQSLKKVLGVVLSIGNFLNGGSNKGQADGFDIEVLGKLSSIKDADGGSMVDYLKKVCDNKYSGLLQQLSKELITIGDASGVSIDDLRSKVGEIQKDFTVCQQAIKNIAKSPSTNRFFEVTTPFMQHAESTVTELQTGYQQMLSDFESMLLYFGVSPQKAKGKNPGDFFAALKEFTGKMAAVAPPPLKKAPSMGLPKIPVKQVQQ